MIGAELDAVSVELDAAELGGPVTIGTLRRTRAPGGSLVGFAYSDDWLARRDAFAIDPLHGLFAGDQWPRDGKIDRIFTDAATDRWGRTLLARHEAHLTRTERRPRRTPGDASAAGGARLHRDGHASRGGGEVVRAWLGRAGLAVGCCGDQLTSNVRSV